MERQSGDVDGQGLVEPQGRAGPEAQHHSGGHHHHQPDLGHPEPPAVQVLDRPGAGDPAVGRRQLAGGVGAGPHGRRRSAGCWAAGPALAGGRDHRAVHGQRMVCEALHAPGAVAAGTAIRRQA